MDVWVWVPAWKPVNLRQCIWGRITFPKLLRSAAQAVEDAPLFVQERSSAFCRNQKWCTYDANLSIKALLPGKFVRILVSPVNSAKRYVRTMLSTCKIILP